MPLLFLHAFNQQRDKLVVLDRLLTVVSFQDQFGHDFLDVLGRNPNLPDTLEAVVKRILVVPIEGEAIQPFDLLERIGDLGNVFLERYV